MNMLKSLILLFSLLASVSYAQEELEKDFRFEGKHYSVTYKLEENLQTIRLHGEILSGIIEDLSGFKKVTTLIRKDIPIKLVLHSGGGFLKAYSRLPRVMKQQCNSETSNCKITTIIPTWAYCASACLNIFMVGDERLAGKSSRFGFHQAAAMPGVLKLSGFAQRSLRKSGLSPEWLELHKELFSSLEISWLYPRQLDGSNMITGLSEEWES